MKKYIIFDKETGRIVCNGVCEIPELIGLGNTNGLLTDVCLEEFSYVDKDGNLVGIPDPVNEFYTFNYTTKQWEDPRTLQDLKAAQWALIKQAREAALTSPLTTSFGIFDADEKAQASITKSIMLLQTLDALGTPGSVDFTLADNSVVVLTLAQMVEVGLTLGAREQAVRATATARRVQIEAATSQAEVEAVVW